MQVVLIFVVVIAAIWIFAYFEAARWLMIVKTPAGMSEKETSMNKPNARELLREARAELAKAHDHLMELTAKLPMQYFGLVDGNIIQAEDCLVDKLDAYLAAPSESAMEMVRQIRDLESYGGGDYEYYLDATEAAALIEDYGRRVPRAMLEEIFEQYPCYIPGKEPNAVRMCIDAIAAKHDVKVD